MKDWNLDFRSFAFVSEGHMGSKNNKGKGQNTASRVRELAQPICDELGLFLWDVRFEKEGATWYLKVFIDKDGGITMDDCEALSRPLSRSLDEADPIEQSYVLEVGSPGLGRELRRDEHFECCIGDEIRVCFIRPQDGEKELIGALRGYEKNKLTLEKRSDGETVEIDIADCAYIKLFDDEDLFNEQ